ncbi:MAG TPA: hypothetical protein VIY52_25745 [Streptosporangiaceae bacterium]
MTRSVAVARASEYFDSGAFLADLARRVAFRTESGLADRHPDLFAYLEQEMVPAAQRLGASARVLDNPAAGGGPLLIAVRHEGAGLPTVLTYGHADVVPAEPWRWRSGLDPWQGTRPDLLPNLGGSLPNDVFTDVLGLPAIWIPHSYPGCAQHAPDEHLLAPLARQALRLMAALFWDLGDHHGS